MKSERYEFNICADKNKYLMCNLFRCVNCINYYLVFNNQAKVIVFGIYKHVLFVSKTGDREQKLINEPLL